MACSPLPSQGSADQPKVSGWKCPGECHAVISIATAGGSGHPVAKKKKVAQAMGAGRDLQKEEIRPALYPNPVAGVHFR